MSTTATEVRSPYQRQGVRSWRAALELFREIETFRWHIGVTFKKGFAAQSQLTRLGTVWNYVLPLVPISVYSVLMAMRLFPSFDGVSALVYISIGVTTWFLFAGLIRGPIDTAASQIRSVTKSGFPLSGAIVANFAQLAFDTAVRSAAVLLVFALFQGLPAWQVIFVPVPLLFGSMLFLGAGLVLSMMNLVYRDVAKLVGIGLQYGILLSSVVFPLEHIPRMAGLLLFNPFYIFIDAIRSLAVAGTLDHPVALLVYSAFAVALLLLGCKTFYALELRFRGLA